jgi:hypothetical protein
LVPLVLLFLVSSFFPGCDICPARLLFAPAKMCFYLLKRKPLPKRTIAAAKFFCSSSATAGKKPPKVLK